MHLQTLSKKRQTLDIMTKLKRLTLTVPPKRGPNPQGLNINYNTVRTSNPEKTINGRNRQRVNPKHR
jgi:hypothetical protein